MSHLSPEQIVDVADGCAAPAVTAHEAACTSCRAKVESLREAARLAAEDEPVEPSPLFWPHLAARIGEAVRREPAPAASWRPWAWRLVTIGAAVVLVVFAGVGARFWIATPIAPAAVPAATAMQGPGVSPTESDQADDPSWLLVSELSAQLSVDDAEATGALPLPGGVERALAHLDDTERLELARILRDAIALREPLATQGPGA